MKRMKLISIIFLLTISSVFFVSVNGWKPRLPKLKRTRKQEAQTFKGKETLPHGVPMKEKIKALEEKVKQEEEEEKTPKKWKRVTGALGFHTPPGELQANLSKFNEINQDLKTVEAKQQIIEEIEKEIKEKGEEGTAEEEKKFEEAPAKKIKKLEETLEEMIEKTKETEETEEIRKKIEEIKEKLELYKGLQYRLSLMPESKIMPKKGQLKYELLEELKKLKKEREDIVIDREIMKGPDAAKLMELGLGIAGLGLGIGGLGFVAESVEDALFGDPELEEDELSLISSEEDKDLLLIDSKKGLEGLETDTKILEPGEGEKELRPADKPDVQGDKIDLEVLNIKKDEEFTVKQAEAYLKKAAICVAVVLGKGGILFSENKKPITITTAKGEEKTIVGNEYSVSSLEKYEKLLDSSEEKKIKYEKTLEEFKALQEKYDLLKESFEKDELEDELKEMEPKIEQMKQNYLSDQKEAEHIRLKREKTILEWSLYYPVTAKKLSAWKLSKLAVNRAKKHTPNFDEIDLTKTFKFLTILDIPVSLLFKKQEGKKTEEPEKTKKTEEPEKGEKFSREIEESEESEKPEKIKESLFERMKRKASSFVKTAADKKEFAGAKITETKEKVVGGLQET